MFNKLAKFTLPLVFGLFALICLPALLAKADAPPQISAVAAVVIDQASGKVLYDKDMNAEHYPASTTKGSITISDMTLALRTPTVRSFRRYPFPSISSQVT